MYKCICGKEFNDDQKQNFLAHKSHCKEHLKAKGTYEEYVARQKRVSALAVEKCKQLRNQQSLDKLNQWISEKHTCERCGKVMTEKFGSGRFCCNSCSKSRNHSEENRKKISYALYKRSGKSDNEISQLQEQLKNPQPKRFIYTGPELPEVISVENKQGYQHYSKDNPPASELFWRAVLERNNIPYESNVHIHKKDSGIYILDIKIDNIDIEIDGELHYTKSCTLKDIERTKYLESLGYFVYRIQWIKPDSQRNKDIVYHQILELFQFLGETYN